MDKSFESAVTSYLRARSLSAATGVEYRSTLSKWSAWGKGVPLASIGRSEVREFLDWVHERAVANEGSNPGRTANKCREHLRAVLSWAWEEELVETLPRFPKSKLQRDIAGRHYLTKTELNALYFATYQLPRPRGWHQRLTLVGIGEVPWCFSSTTDWILVLFGNGSQFTSRSCGETCVGLKPVPMAVVRYVRRGDGLPIVA